MEALQQQINELKAEIDSLKSANTIPYDIEQAFKTRLSSLLITLPDGFEGVPYPLITAPSGGATVDSQARTAINAIITTLEELTLIYPN